MYENINIIRAIVFETNRKHVWNEYVDILFEIILYSNFK